jgi:DNA-binding response OmpR family regulator
MRRNKRILVVDDNPVNLRILEEILVDEYQVKFAQNGHDALHIASTYKPAFILLDVMMPGLDGLQVCRQLRENSALKNTAIIMVSAKAMPSEQIAGMNAGADDYITKPFDEVELLEMLRRYQSREPMAHAGADGVHLAVEWE